VITGAGAAATAAAAAAAATAAAAASAALRGFVAEASDWAVVYPLTAAAVVAESALVIDAVTRLGDTYGTQVYATDPPAAKLALAGAALEAHVRSVLAYAPVEHRSLFRVAARPTGVVAADDEHLCVVAVAAGGLVVCACNGRLAGILRLAALPSPAALASLSFVQLQHFADFTSSYFMQYHKTSLGTVVCRAFRLITYNIGAVLLLVAVLALLLVEQSPLRRRFRRVAPPASKPS
jgi:hypothetical protein